MDYKTNLKEAMKLLIADQDDTFKVYKDRKILGSLVFKDLLDRRSGIDSNGNPLEGFYLTPKNREVGLMTRLIGLNGVLNLISRYNVEPTDAEKKIIYKDIKDVLAYIEKHGYDASPYLDDDTNAFYFKENRVDGKKISYMDSRTWAFSLFLEIRKLHNIETAKGGKKLLDFSPFIESVNTRIKLALRFFVDSVVIDKNGDAVGWGFANGCEEPSLYFTYTLLEAFSDFEDACLLGSNRDEDFLEFLNEGNTYDKPIEDEFRDKCFRVGDIAWNMFGHIIKDAFVSDRFDDKFRIIPRDEIINSSRSNVLFNTIYIVFIWLYSYKNNHEIRPTQWGNIESEDAIDKCEDVKVAMAQALSLVQTLYDELVSEGKDSIVSRHIIAFDQDHKIERFGKELNDANILTASLLPMLAKANNLVAFYIHKFPQQKMGVLFERMIGARLLSGEWLWANRLFDLLSTVRYIGSIADFYDYYDTFEKKYAEKSTSTSKMKKDLTDELKRELEPAIAKDVRQKLAAKHKQDLDEMQARNELNFPIEVQINKRVNEIVDKRVMEIIGTMFNDFAKFNKQKGKNEKASMTEENAKVYAALNEYVMSHFDQPLKKASDVTGKASIDLLGAANIDIMTAAKEFFEFTADNMERKGLSKLSLANIFELIKKEKE
ncbi:MAG: hypothetical protein FWE45_00325 [Firmicutes bacterium]|nr:hypothetical protein [Bacillota bacterium]